MAILQSGIGKSGNLWVYRILEGILDRSGVAPKSFICEHPIAKEASRWSLSHEGQSRVDDLFLTENTCHARISNLFDEEIADVDAYIAACRHVWTHSPVTKRGISVIPKFEHVFYIVRDPRDVALSMSRYVFTPHILRTRPHHERDPASYLDYHFDRLTRSWVHHVAGYLEWQQHWNLHLVFYERLIARFDEELERIVQTLGVSLDRQDLAAIKHQVSLPSMQSVDPSHVAVGRARQWQQRLDDRLKAEAERIAGPMLELLSYPSGNKDPELPAPPPPDVDLAAAREHARRNWRDKARQTYHFVVSRRPLRAKLHGATRWIAERRGDTSPLARPDTQSPAPESPAPSSIDEETKR